MKIKVTDTILSYEGKPIKNVKDKEVTYRDELYFALNNFMDTERPTAEQKQKSFQVTNKLFSKDEPDFTTTEVAYMIERAKVILYPLALGRVLVLLGELKIDEIEKPVDREVVEETSSL